MRCGEKMNSRTDKILHWPLMSHIYTNYNYFYVFLSVPFYFQQTTMGRLLQFRRGTFKKGHSVILKCRAMTRVSVTVTATSEKQHKAKSEGDLITPEGAFLS